ncbi:GNAT family N-acetyltransferase [Roseovarius phycicola]|uniref:GNAT family N-acetyltransferase n=1 Tax=Roseovarius phycicola TaxID=3080976 RepID=A0ABZ2HGV6_9RHOB
MTPEDLAVLHERAFEGQGRSWTASEFSELLQNRAVALIGDNRAFALGRLVADEAELLTLACDPICRRQGLARDRLDALLREVKAKGALRIFLEVASDNLAAISLYQKAEFVQIGRRKEYHDTPNGRVDAIVMEKRL